MNELQNRANYMWTQLAPWQRIAGIATVVSAIGLVFLMGLWMREPAMGVLYRGLNEQDAAAVVGELEAQGIIYRLAENGRTIEVNAEEVASTRLKLASKNLPTGGNGYELFDKDALSGIGMTDFMQRMNFQRALEGEIARSIASIDGVELARVHIAIPEETLFSEQQKEPTASVILKLRTGTRLSPTQVEAMRFLLANSVEGMKAANISVVDMAGNLYEVPETASDGSPVATSSQIETEQLLESKTQRDLQMMLDSTLGAESTVVRVNVELNWDREESVSEEYAPAGQVGSVVRSNQQSEENWTGAPAAGVGGVPGVDANAPVDTPTYPTVGDDANSGEYNRRTSTTNYEVSKRVTNSVKQPGSIERMTVAVLMNDALPAEQVEIVKNLVAAAVGINPERGDLIQVERIPFNETHQAEATAAIAQMQQQDMYIRIGTIAAILLGLGMVLFFVRRSFSEMQKRMMPYVIEPTVPALPADEASGQMPTPLSAQNSARSAYGDSLTVNENEYDDFLRLPAPDEVELRLRAVARHNPDIVASILESWISRHQEDMQAA